MPLLNAKCTNCGANLKVDNAKDAAICDHCGSAFIVEKAINNYNITNNIQAGVVNIYGMSNDFDIRGGVLVKYNGTSMQPAIPNTVAKIGDHAFLGTMITSVVIPESVEVIGNSAFSDCARLTNVTIPKSVVEIQYSAFNRCTRLTKVKIPGNVRIVDAAFTWCENVQSVTISEGVERISYGAFGGCFNIQTLELPSTLVYIGDSAFGGCHNLTNVTNKCRISKGEMLRAFGAYSGDDFVYTPYGRKIQSEIWRDDGRCVYCGGELNVFRTCKRCKKKN